VFLENEIDVVELKKPIELTTDDNNDTQLDSNAKDLANI